MMPLRLARGTPNARSFRGRALQQLPAPAADPRCSQTTGTLRSRCHGARVRVRRPRRARRAWLSAGCETAEFPQRSMSRVRDRELAVERLVQRLPGAIRYQVEALPDSRWAIRTLHRLRRRSLPRVRVARPASGPGTSRFLAPRPWRPRAHGLALPRIRSRRSASASRAAGAARLVTAEAVGRPSCSGGRASW